MAAIMRDTAGGNKIKPLRRWDFDRFHRGSHPVYRDLSLSVSISRFFSLSQACQNNWDNKEREREYWNTLYYAECVTCIVISRSTDFTITLLECIALEYNLGEVSKRGARVYYEFSD